VGQVNLKIQERKYRKVKGILFIFWNARGKQLISLMIIKTGSDHEENKCRAARVRLLFHTKNTVILKTAVTRAVAKNIKELNEIRVSTIQVME
jgi:hypothetical protein